MKAQGREASQRRWAGKRMEDLDQRRQAIIARWKGGKQQVSLWKGRGAVVVTVDTWRDIKMGIE